MQAQGLLRGDKEGDLEARRAECDAGLAAFGLYLEEEDQARVYNDDEPFFVYPECVPMLNLWNRLQSRWLFGPMGPTGLDFAGIEAWLRLARHPLRREPDTADCLLAMEQATLVAWQKRREENKS